MTTPLFYKTTISGGIALPKIEQFKKEGIWLVISFIILNIIFSIAFYKSPMGETIRAVLSFYWMFVLPGYAIALCLNRNFVERMIIGIALQIAIFGIASYYAGLLGWHVSTHGLIMPLFSLILGLALWWKSSASQA